MKTSQGYPNSSDSEESIGQRFSTPRRSYSECDGSMLSIESSRSSASQRRDQLAEARFARKKAERDARLAKIQADIALEHAIASEELAEELLASAEFDEGLQANVSRGSVYRQPIARSAAFTDDNVQKQLDLVTNVIAQQSLDSVKVEKFDGNPIDYARWLNDVQVKIECYTSCPKKLMNKVSDSVTKEVRDRAFPSIVDGTLEQYKYVKDRIRELYGRPEIIVRCFLESVKSAKRVISTKDVSGLVNFETRLKKVSDSIRALCQLGQIKDPTVLLSAEHYAAIAAKLPESWEDELIDRLEDKPALETILVFVERKLSRKRSLYGQLVAEKSQEEKKASKSGGANVEMKDTSRGVFNTVVN